MGLKEKAPDVARQVTSSAFKNPSNLNKRRPVLQRHHHSRPKVIFTAQAVDTHCLLSQLTVKVNTITKAY
jgi:hypothetical protein